MTGIPGLRLAGTPSPFYARLVTYGTPKAGKTTFAATWPAPVFIHPEMESGYDSIRLGGTHIFDTIRYGSTHHLWLDKVKGTRPVTEELDEIIQRLAVDLYNGKCPYKTLVFGAVSLVQGMVVSEAERLKSGNMQVWGYVAQWMRRFVQSVCSLPVHVILELSADPVRKEEYTGRVLRYEPQLSGKASGIVLHSVNATMFVQNLGGGQFMADMTERPYCHAEVRLRDLWMPQPLRSPTDDWSRDGLSYDFFAARLGLPPIWEADPNHPRNWPGFWPWPHPANK